VHDVVRKLYRRLAGTAGDAMPTIGKYLGDPVGSHSSKWLANSTIVRAINTPTGRSS
jgi:hypothetical protein